jgi:POT family proton-dependent oligopeptide transporter
MVAAKTSIVPEAPARQPKALYLLMAGELLDRFAYYAFLSVFVLYLTQTVGISESRAFLIFGAFTSFAALTTLAGGFAADHIFGFGRSIIAGAGLLCVGYATLAFGGETLLYVALATVIAGNGLVHGNLPALLGLFYGDDDPRRENGFTYLYLAINLGGFLGALAMGLLATRFGYGAAFAVSAAAKLLFLITFVAGRGVLEGRERPPEIARNAQLYRTAGGLAVAAMLAACVVLLEYPDYAAGILFVVGGFAVGAYIVLGMREEVAVRRRVFVHLVIVGAAVVFWAIYQQYAASVLVFISDDTDRSILGWKVPPSEFTALNAGFVLLVGPVLTRMWLWLNERGYPVKRYSKFALGLVFTGIAYLLLGLGIATTPAGAKTVLFWIVVFQFVIAIGEMCVSPVGFALTSALAPKRLAGFAMGIWYLAVAIAFFLSGVIALPVAGKAPEAASPFVFGVSFAAYGVAGAVMGMVIMALIPRLRRLASD